MWKRPAPWVVPSIAALLAIWPSVSVRAGDLGETVAFPGASALRFSVAGTEQAGDVLFDSGESAWLKDPWDTLIFEGLSPDAGVSFEAARKDASGAWTPWVVAFVKRHPGGRFWGRASFSAAPGAARLRAVAAGPRLRHVVSVYGIESFLSGPEAAEASSSAAPAAPAASRPPVIARAEWGAKAPKAPWEPDEPKKFTVHHTDGPQTMTVADSIKEVQFIQDFHQNGRGWNDIAYHFLIDGVGNVFEGRPLGTLGAHTLHANPNNVGIALLGTHQSPQNHPFLTPKRAAFVRLGRWLTQTYGFDASTLRGHRDYKATDCPGDIVYAELDALRREIAAPQPAAGLSAGAPSIALPAWVRARPAWDGVHALP